MKERSIINFTVGATVGAVLAMVLAIVALDLAQLPKFWAYFFLGLIVLVIGLNILLLARGNQLIGKLFGVESDDLNNVLDEASKDVDNGNFGNLVRVHAPVLLSQYATYRAKAFAAFLLLALLGELVLVVQVAALIEQTKAIKVQTERFTQQTLRDLFWQLHNDPEGTNRTRAFRELLINGQLAFEGFKFRNVDLSGMNLPNVRFRNSDFVDSTFVGTTMVNANMEQTIFRGSDFSRSRLQGVFEGSNFSSSNFTNATLSGNFDRIDFSSSNLMSANLEGASFNEANFTGAKVTPEQLSKAHYLQSVIGVPDEIMIKVKEINPKLLQFWKPN